MQHAHVNAEHSVRMHLNNDKLIQHTESKL